MNCAQNRADLELTVTRSMLATGLVQGHMGASMAKLVDVAAQLIPSGSVHSLSLSEAAFAASYFPSQELSEPAPPSDIPDLPSFESAQNYGEDNRDASSPSFDDHHEPREEDLLTGLVAPGPVEHEISRRETGPTQVSLRGDTDALERAETVAGLSLGDASQTPYNPADFDPQAVSGDEANLEDNDDDREALVGGAFATGDEGLSASTIESPEPRDIDTRALDDANYELTGDDNDISDEDSGDSDQTRAVARKNDDEVTDDKLVQTSESENRITEAGDDSNAVPETNIPGEWVVYGTCREVLVLKPRGGIETAIRSAFVESVNVEGHAFKLRNPGEDDTVMVCPAIMGGPSYAAEVDDYLMEIACLGNTEGVPEVFKLRCDSKKDADHIRKAWNLGFESPVTQEFTTTTTTPEPVTTGTVAPTRPPLPEYLGVGILRHSGSNVMKEMPTFPTVEEKMRLHEVHLLFDSLEIRGDTVSGYTLSGNRATIMCNNREHAESLMLNFAGQVQTVAVRAGKFSPELAEEAEAVTEKGETASYEEPQPVGRNYRESTTAAPPVNETPQQSVETMPPKEADIKEHRASGGNDGEVPHFLIMCLRLRVAAALFGLELAVATLSTVRSETRKALTLDHRTYAVSTSYRKGKQAKQKSRTEFRKTQGDSLICRVRDINNDDS
ncbi:hypothetical protein FOZ63_019132, partial [Perkinsus olseni]